jgi:DNA segregation ATPase FtsK/SpoIIIE, S-DNA-T family
MPMSENSQSNLNSSRDTQRQALNDLVSLARQSTAQDAQLDKEYRLSQSALKREFTAAVAEIEQRYSKLREELEDRALGAKRQFEDQYTAESNSLKAADGKARHKIEFENDSLQQDIKKQFAHANWVADSIFDGSQHQAREDYRIARDQHAGQVETVEKLQHNAASVVAAFGHQIPEIVVPENESSPIGDDAEETFKQEKERAEQLLLSLRQLKAPSLFVGIWPYLGTIVFLLVGGVTGQAIKQTTQPDWTAIGIGLGSGLIVAIVVGAILWNTAKKQIRATYLPLLETTRAARRAADAHLKAMEKERDQKLERANKKREAEFQAAKDKFQPILGQAKKQHVQAVAAAKTQFDLETRRIETQRSKGLGEANERFSAFRSELEEKYRGETAGNQQRFDSRTASATASYESAGSDLQNRWTNGLANLQSQLTNEDEDDEKKWDPQNWRPATRFPSTILFGSLEVNVKDMVELPADSSGRLVLPEAFDLPAVLALPRQASLLIQTDRAGHAQAMDAMRMAMARILTLIPPGRAKFTIIDPVGLGQNFAGFMHLADHDESLVNSRIWTEAEHIEQRLADLTEHMETVIQKYLRNEFQTIDEYNAQAGELAEPYRFLVVADFPVGFEGESFRRLASIASSGPRCGVYTLVLRDLRQPLPPGTHIDELESRSVNLVRQNDKWVWKDEVFKQFPLSIDLAPDDATLIKLLDVVGQKAKEAKRIEVAFSAIAPKPDELWSNKSDREIVVPVGRLGANRLQNVRLGRGVAQHALIAGKTGSGKSTLLHVLITNLALWYSPDEMEFYLVDFKKGVEFKTYATHHLPHARAIAVESDREFGLSVLQRLDAELTRRGELFRKLGVQDLAAYRLAASQRNGGDDPVRRDATGLNEKLPRLPRTLLIIDEFQEFFSEDDKLAQDAALLIDRLVRQGRAFGIHVILGSQTLGGAGGLARSTLGQMAVRVALQTTEADSQLILGDNNSAARLLSRPGEAIYNDQGGLVEANSPFQISWLNDDERDLWLDRISAKMDASIENASEPVVFEGNAPSDIRKNARLAAMMQTAPKSRPAATAFLGEPVAIKDATGVTFRRQAASNMLIIGQQDESAMAMFVATMVSLSAQHSANSAIFYLLDGTPADSQLAGTLPSMSAILPQNLNIVDYRAVPETMDSLAAELKRRRESDDSSYPEIYVLVFGLQRYRMLRKSEEAFSFGSEEKKTPPDQQFAELLRDGAQLGIHIIAWCDTPANIERSLDRASLREFDHRILFQMSANDSSNLIDSPTANRLGFHRALAFSEEHGTLEKFRPYGIPDKQWLHGVANQLIARATAIVS